MKKATNTPVVVRQASIDVLIWSTTENGLISAIYASLNTFFFIFFCVAVADDRVARGVPIEGLRVSRTCLAALKEGKLYLVLLPITDEAG